MKLSGMEPMTKTHNQKCRDNSKGIAPTKTKERNGGIALYVRNYYISIEIHNVRDENLLESISVIFEGFSFNNQTFFKIIFEC